MTITAATTSRVTAETRVVEASLTLVIRGDDDLMIPTRLSHLLAGLIMDARIRIYPDAVHGFLFQCPTDGAADVNAFLET